MQWSEFRIESNHWKKPCGPPFRYKLQKESKWSPWGFASGGQPPTAKVVPQSSILSHYTDTTNICSPRAKKTLWIVSIVREQPVEAFSVRAIMRTPEFSLQVELVILIVIKTFTDNIGNLVSKCSLRIGVIPNCFSCRQYWRIPWRCYNTCKEALPVDGWPQKQKIITAVLGRGRFLFALNYHNNKRDDHNDQTINSKYQTQDFKIWHMHHLQSPQKGIEVNRLPLR